jgi:ribonuclease HIII
MKVSVTTEVFKIDPKKLAALKELLLKHQSATLLPPTNPYEDFRVKCSDGLVVGYSTGKIVANTPEVTKLVSTAIQGLAVGEGQYGIVIGSDEAGKGEWLGPITIAAVALTPEQSSLLVAKGVMDSKLLSTARIMNISDVIRTNALSFHVVAITPERFNSLLSEVRDEGKSLNDMLAWGHAKAIETVYNHIPSGLSHERIKVVIDEFDKLRTERRLMRVLNLRDIALEQYPKAEEETAVASAGILARAEWEVRVDKETERTGIDLRNLSLSEAKKHPQVNLFAKISYLH